MAERFTNHLAGEQSPYLRQHAHNPVDWFAWGDAAFARARAENRPVFLSIGYSTCHWCHVMERETFEQEAVGRFLNEHFVSIKVDREERPDVDKIYMTFVQSTTGAGGWPLNVFLTPDLKPFFAGRPAWPAGLSLPRRADQRSLATTPGGSPRLRRRNSRPARTGGPPADPGYRPPLRHHPATRRARL